MTDTPAVAARSTDAAVSDEPWRRRLWRQVSHPRTLTGAAFVFGWSAATLLWAGYWAGFLFALVTSGMAILAVKRGKALGRARRATLAQTIDSSEARNRELDLLRRLGSVLLSVRSSGELLQEAVQLASALLRAQGSAVMLVAEEGRFLRIAAGDGLLRSGAGRLLPMERSLAGWAAAHDAAVLTDNVEADPRAHPERLFPDVRTAICVPLRSQGVVIGAACAYNREDGAAFSDHDVRLLLALAEQVAVGLDRAFMLEESRRNERALAEKNRELVRAQKLKDEFLANMSHELRTPLNAIIGFSDLMLAPGVAPLDEQQRDFLESIARNGRHLLGLINSVLDLSKIEAGRMTVQLTRLDIRDAIQAAVTDTTSLRAGKRQQCTVEVGGTPLEVVADHQRVRQVLFNLLSNASKFTPDAGTVSLSAVHTLVPLPAPTQRAGEQARLVTRDAVWVSVRDTGIGIKQEDVRKLFQAFTQVDSSTSRSQQGTGLGLALCRQFVELHGGTIGVESVPGEGSTFWFILPVEGPIRHPQ